MTLVRGFVLAWLLSASDFGIYALVMGVGTFSGSALGLGRIEQTNKIFPRLFIDGRSADAIREADSVARLVFRNAVVTLAAVAAVLLLAGRSEWLGPALAAGAVSLGVAWVAIYISLQRASGDLLMVGRANLIRALLALSLSGAGASLGPWQLSVAGEVIAACVGAWIFRHYAKRGCRSAPLVAPLEPARDDGRYWLFGGFLLAAAPLYLDRAFILAVYGAADAGAYSFLMLFVAAAATVTTILVQKLGPQIVRMERQGTGKRAQIRLLLGWASGMIGLTAIGMAAATAALLWGPAASLGVKYGLTPALFAATAILGFTQAGALLDWILLSHDKERLVFSAAAIYMVAVAISAVLVVRLDAPMLTAIWALAGSKLLQILVQGGLIVKLRSGSSVAHDG